MSDVLQVVVDVDHAAIPATGGAALEPGDDDPRAGVRLVVKGSPRVAAVSATARNEVGSPS